MLRWLALFLLLVPGLAGCENAGPDADPDRPARVLCTTGMITDLVQRVAGDQAEVHGLIGAGIDPHLYQPTRTDIAALQRADIVFYNGLLLEGKMTDVLVRMAGRGIRVVAVTEGLDPQLLLEPPEMQGHYDPHVWMDVAAWSQAVHVIVKTLGDHRPLAAETFASNGAVLRQELASLDTYVRDVLATIPAEQRLMVTAHDAFNYFGRAYGLEVLGIQGLSTESEAGLNDINRLVNLIVERKVRAVFVETSVADKNVRALVEGAAAQGHDVRIGGTLFSDAMGRLGTYEGTYVGMLDHNATTVTRALGGTAPAGGMQGRLAGGDGEDGDGEDPE